jgi:nitrogen fixation protein NifU and related proteins
VFEDVRDLYSDTILEHGRRPRHAGRPEGADREARGDNPMCGDRVTVFVRQAAGQVAAAGFDARGCDLVKASADLMCEAVVGRSPLDIRALAAQVETMARTGTCPDCNAAMEALKPLSAVHEYPSRLRCVTLPWQAVVAALETAP